MMTGSRAIASAAVVAAALLGLCLPASAQEERKWGAFLDVEGKAGTKRSIGEVELFVPLLQDEDSMLFGTARFKADDQSSAEGNFGLGARRMLADGWNIGGYGYFDHRRSPNANLFDQLTFGAELLGTNVDLRANSYWPVGNGVQEIAPSSSAPAAGSSTAAVSGTSIVVTTAGQAARSFEYAMRGFDAETGLRIPITPAESPYNLRVYAGGFRFDEASGAVPVIAGPRLRLEFTDYAVPGLWNGTRFTVGAGWQSDDVRGSQFFAGLRLRVPLQAEARRSSFTLQERRMTDTIVRDVDIVTGVQTTQGQSSLVELATQTTGGQAITVINSSSTTGANLPTTVANAGTNRTLVLVGTFNTTANTVMQSGQTMMGSGSLGVRTASGRTATANLPGATISGGAGNTVSMADNSTLSGMTVSTSGTTAVFVNSVASVTITNNTLTSVGTTININGFTGTSTVSNNSVSTSGGGTALGINGGAGTNITVSGNTLSATGGGRHTAIQNVTVQSGSTGNVISAGTCGNLGGVTGSISYTNGTTCP